MATNIIEKEGKYYLTQCWCEKDESICLQITPWQGKYIQLTLEETKQFIKELSDWVKANEDWYSD